MKTIKKTCSGFKERCLKKKALGLLLIATFLFRMEAIAQNGNAGIQKANEAVRSYFDSGTDLMYAVGALLGLIGAVKVYQK